MLDGSNNVLAQCNGYWVPHLHSLIKQYKLEHSDSSEADSGYETMQLTPEAAEIQKLFDDAISSVEELDSWDNWLVKVLEPYLVGYSSNQPNKHNTDYGGQWRPTNFLDNPDYIRVFEKMKTRPDIFARFTRGTRVKGYGNFGNNLIYLETPYMTGPCWAPSLKLLKVLYWVNY